MGLPFVMGTTGGDRQLLHKTVQDANTYAVISPQMGKQVMLFPSCNDQIWIILNINIFLHLISEFHSHLPFQVVYGWEPPSLCLFTPGEVRIPTVQAQLQQRDEFVVEVHEWLE
jgi:hypothetical protein